MISILEGRFGDLALEVMLLIAGRNRLEEGWDSEYILPFLETIHLERFSIEEAEGYLRDRGVTEKAVVDVILGLSERVPLLMTTLANNIPDNPDQIGDPTGKAIERFLKWVPDSGQRRAIITCAIPRLLDLDLVALLTGKKDVDRLFDYIKSMSFVSKRVDAGWKYHDVIRVFMLRHLREDSAQRWLDLQKLLIEYFLTRRNDLGLDLRAGFRNKAWQSYDLEWIYHSVCAYGRSAAKVWVERLLDCDELTSPNEFDIRIGEAVEQAGEVLDDANMVAWGRRIQEGIRAGYINNDYSRAMPLAESIVGLACTMSSTRHAQAISWRGWIHFKLGEYEAALQDYAHAIEIHPVNWKSYYRRGLLLRDKGDREAALSEYARAIELQPDDGANYAGRGWTYYQMGDYEAALQDYARTIELQPEIDYRYRERGQIHLNLGKDNEAALQDFSYAIQLKPTGSNYLWRGWACYQMGNYAAALQDYARAIELQPDDGANYTGRGWTYYQMGDYEAALQDYARAIELQPDRAFFYSERAAIHRELGHDLNAALQDYNRAIELAPQEGDLFYRARERIAAWAITRRRWRTTPVPSSCSPTMGPTTPDAAGRTIRWATTRRRCRTMPVPSSCSRRSISDTPNARKSISS